jgi:hypothetical protein
MTKFIRLFSLLFPASDTDIVNTAQSNLLALREIAEGRPIGGLSMQCQAVLRTYDASPKCAKDVKDDIMSDDFDKMCIRPADGIHSYSGYRCSRNQVT